MWPARNGARVKEPLQMVIEPFNLDTVSVASGADTTKAPHPPEGEWGASFVLHTMSVSGPGRGPSDPNTGRQAYARLGRELWDF